MEVWQRRVYEGEVEREGCGGEMCSDGRVNWVDCFWKISASDSSKAGVGLHGVIMGDLPLEKVTGDA